MLNLLATCHQPDCGVELIINQNWNPSADLTVLRLACNFRVLRPVADHKKLDKIADMIEKNLKAGKRLLVHCGAGVERSPLAVMWFLHRKYGLSLDEAYSYVKARRPQTMDSLDWLTNK